MSKKVEDGEGPGSTERGKKISINSLNVQNTLDFLKWSCKGHPHLRVKIAVDCIKKGYASPIQVADFLGLGVDRWNQFYHNYLVGDVGRIPKPLRDLVSTRDLRFFAGFTDEQLDILVRILEMPLLLSDKIEDCHPLLQELKVLIVFGVLLVGKHNQFKSYSLKVMW
ncbi:MAG: hypothetical protein QM401_08500 [Bacillota bacterium]|nr:hypothetical protein [Bacillota bacterium]HHU61684.1 hypothetical protein [Natronincola sp.]